jgi:two-component system, cell cycle response regulator CpdR
MLPSSTQQGVNNLATILIAEDDRAVREFVSRALQRDGHDVTTVEDGMEALEALANNNFDMLLSDVVMPQLDGIALALKVSKDYPELPILLMTGYAAERQRAHNLDALIHDVIPKPFTLKDIQNAAARTLDN